jgi:hypothetical protein
LAYIIIIIKFYNIIFYHSIKGTIMKYSLILLSFILSLNVFAGRAASKYQAVESCKYTTPKCTTTSNGAATTINTTCNGGSINNYSDTALKYRATANGNELYVEWIQNGTGQSKSELISFNDIQVNSCSSQDLLKETGIQACQGVAPATTGVNDYLGCGSNYFVTRSAADLNKLILTYNPYGSDVNSGNDYKEWKYVTPSQLNIAVYQDPSVISKANALNACQNTNPACRNWSTESKCGDSNYFVQRNPAVVMNGITYREETLDLQYRKNGYYGSSSEDKTYSIDFSELSGVTSCSNPEPVVQTGNITSAINECKNYLTPNNSCSVSGNYKDSEEIACGHTAGGNYYSIKMLSNSNVILKGYGEKQLSSSVLSPTNSLYNALNLPTCEIPEMPETPIEIAQEPTTIDAISACIGNTLSCGVGSSVCANNNFKVYRESVNNNAFKVIYEVDSSNINYAFNNKTWNFTNTQLGMEQCVTPPPTNHYENAKTACAGKAVACSINEEQTQCSDEYKVVRAPFSMGGDNSFMFVWQENGVDVLAPVIDGDFIPSNQATACNEVIKQTCNGKLTECSVSNTSNSCGHGYTVNRIAFDPAGSGTGGEIFITKDNDSSFNLPMTVAEAGANACYSNNDHRTNAINKCSELNLACGSSDVNQSCGTENGFNYRIARTGFDKFLNTGGEITLSAVSSEGTVWSGTVGASTVNADSCAGYSTTDLYSMAKNSCAGKSTSCSLNSESSTSCNTIEGAEFSIARKAFAAAEGEFKFKVEYKGSVLLDTDVASGDYSDVNPAACNSIIKTVCGNNASSVNTCSNSATSDSCGYHGYRLERDAYNPTGDGSGGELQITQNSNIIMSVSANDVGVSECKSNNYYVNNNTCRNDVNNYCTESGYNNRACGDNYYLTRENYDMENNLGGGLLMRLPNGYEVGVSRGDVGAKECISSARHKNNAITLCSTFSNSFGESSCSQSGRAKVSCGSADGFDYKADRSPFNKVTDVGGKINLHSFYNNYTGVWNKQINSTEIGAHECKVEVPVKEETKNAIDIDADVRPNILESAF